MTYDTHDQPLSPKDYKKALTQTISGDSFNEQSIRDLTRTIGEGTSDENISNNEDIKKILLDTLEFDQLDQKFIDFYPRDETSSFNREVETHDAQWNSNDHNAFGDLDSESLQERLEDNYVPGRYKINTILGSGASGQVFSTEDNNLERSIAIKFMHPQHMKTIGKVESFIREAQTTATLNHPNILPIHDLDFTDGALPFFSMRKVQGLTLEHIIDHAATQSHPCLTNNIKKVGVIIKVCNAIAYAHSKGVVHGDIKPGNIMVGEHENIIVLDWGSSTDPTQREKSERKIIGTPMYMSPEQARIEDCTELSDIYCVGSTLLHFLTLRYPLYHHDPRQFWELKKQGHYTSPSTQEKRDIPLPLLSIVSKAMHADPQQRYSSIDAMRQDLFAFLSGDVIAAHHDSIWDLCIRLYQKNKTTIFLLFATITAIATIGIFIYFEKLKELSSWQLIYSENFDHYTQQDLAQNWSASLFPGWDVKLKQATDLFIDQSWVLQQGKLLSRNPYSGFQGSNDISPNITITGDIKFSFDVSHEKYLPYCNVFVGGRDRFSGYTFHVGRWGGERLVTLTKGSDMLPLKFGNIDIELPTNNTWNYIVEKTDASVRLFINKQLILEYIDPVPLIGTEHEYLGVEGDGSARSIDNFKVWTKHLPEKIHSITLADNYLSNGYPEFALETYDELRQERPEDQELCAQALYRSAQCLIKLKRFKEARLRLLQFNSLYSQNIHVFDSLMTLASVYIELDDGEALDKTLRRIGERYHKNQATQWVFEKAINYYEKTLQLSSASFVEANAYSRVMKLTKNILSFEQNIGYEIPEYSNLAKSSCAFNLFRLGYIDDLLSNFPQSKYSIRYYSTQNDFKNLETNFPNSNERASILLKAQKLDEYLAAFPNGPALFGYWASPKLLESLLPKLAENPHYLKAFKDRIEYLNNYWVTLNELIVNERFNEAAELLQQKDKMTTAWTHHFFKNMCNLEQYVIDDPSQELNASIQARVILAIKAWERGEHDKAHALLLEMHLNRNEFCESSFNSFIISPFFRWLEDHNHETFFNSIREALPQLQGRYNNSVSTQLQFLLGDIDFPTLIEHPGHQSPNGETKQFMYCLRAIRLELLGNTKEARENYSLINNPAENIMHSDAYVFARSRLRLLKKISND